MRRDRPSRGSLLHPDTHEGGESADGVDGRLGAGWGGGGRGPLAAVPHQMAAGPPAEERPEPPQVLHSRRSCEGRLFSPLNASFSFGEVATGAFHDQPSPQPFPSPMAPNTTCTKLTRSKRLRRPSRRKELQMSDTRNIPFASKIKTEKPSGEENGFGFPSRDRIQSNPIELSKESAFNWNSGSARQRLLFYWKATQTYSFVP